MMAGQNPKIDTTTGISAANLAKNDALLNNFNATRPKINPNFIPNARGLMKGTSYLPNYSNWG
jgi:hypothetical protein